MTFDDAKTFMIPFGKYRGMTLDAIAAKGDDDLLYLDWVVEQNWLKGMIKEALGIYLADPGIRREIEKAQADRRRD